MTDVDEIRRKIRLHSKRCPNCGSPDGTSHGGVDGLPLTHTCIYCRHTCSDAEALPSIARFDPASGSYKLERIMSQWAVFATSHPDFGRQVWTKVRLRTRRNDRCAQCGGPLSRQAFRPITNGYNRMHRICGCLLILARGVGNA